MPSKMMTRTTISTTLTSDRETIIVTACLALRHVSYPRSSIGDCVAVRAARAAAHSRRGTTALFLIHSSTLSYKRLATGGPLYEVILQTAGQHNRSTRSGAPGRRAPARPSPASQTPPTQP